MRSTQVVVSGFTEIITLKSVYSFDQNEKHYISSNKLKAKTIATASLLLTLIAALYHSPSFIK